MTVHVLSDSERRCPECGVSLRGRQSNTRYCGSTCRARHAKAKPPRRAKPSGAQISWRKAVRVLADALRSAETDDADRLRLAEDILRPALPAKQRARLR